MPEFIKENPFTTQSLANQRFSQQRDLTRAQIDRSDFALAEAERQSTEAQGIDAAYRDAVLASAPKPAMPPMPAAPVAPSAPAMAAPPTESPAPQTSIAGMDAAGSGAPAPQPIGAPPVQQPPQPQPAAAPAPQQRPPSRSSLAAQRLAQTPGGGRLAFDMQAQEQKQTQDRELEILRLSSNPATVAQAAYLATQYGIEIPQEIMRNARYAQAVAAGKDLYDDVGQARNFVKAYMGMPEKTDMEAAVSAGILAAGAPQRTKWGVTNDGGELIWYDMANPRNRITEPMQARPTAPTTQIAGDGNMYAADPSKGTLTPMRAPEGAPQPTFQRFSPGRGGAGSSALVKLGADGTLYPADHEGPGADGKPVIVMPAREAVARANALNRSDTALKLREMIGDDQLAVQDLRNTGNAVVADTRAKASIDIATAKARTGTAGGALNFIANRLMDESPGLTYEAALNKARARDRTPDVLRSLENMALQAAKTDARFERASKAGTGYAILQEWRKIYGLTGTPAAGIAGAKPTAAPAAAPAAPAAAAPANKYGPPGTKIMQNGVEYTVGPDGIPK